MDLGSLEDHPMNQDIQNLKDVEKHNNDEEMLSLQDIDLNGEPELQERNEEKYFIFRILFFICYFLIYVIFIITV
jgi:hypothetical protein